jgi:hypothetical protein
MVIDLSKGIQLASRITSSLLNEPLVKVVPLIGKGSKTDLFNTAARFELRNYFVGTNRSISCVITEHRSQGDKNSKTGTNTLAQS